MEDADRSFRYAETNKTIVRASLYLGAFALLEKSVIGAVTFFYRVEDSTSKAWKKYIEEVTIFSDDLFTSSCIWLEKNKVIRTEQFSAFLECKNRRDTIAEKFSAIVLQDVFTDRGDAPTQKQKIELVKAEFDQMIDLLHRVEAWRAAVDYGLPFSGEDEDIEAIFPISVMGMIRVSDLAFPRAAETDT